MASLFMVLQLPFQEKKFIAHVNQSVTLFECDHLQIVEQGLMTQSDYDEASSKALSLFEYGQVAGLNSSFLAQMFTLTTLWAFFPFFNEMFIQVCGIV